VRVRACTCVFEGKCVCARVDWGARVCVGMRVFASVDPSAAVWVLTVSSAAV
jgi:hypothetical protein